MERESVAGKLNALLDKKFETETEYFVVEVKVLPTNKVEVYVDGDKGITIDKCAEISRYLEQYLDTELPLGDRYNLEVSSPGMDRPLKVLRQYMRRIGREVSVVTLDGENIEGVLKAVDEEKIGVEQQIMEKKKIVDTIQHEIPFSLIKRTKLKLNF